MTLTDGRPRHTDTGGSPEALIREARRRQRRRWALIAALVLVGGGISAVLIRDGDGQAGRHARSPRPEASSLPPASVPPTLEGLSHPSTLAVANDGSLLIADQGTYQIKRRAPNGLLQVVVGSGSPGYSGDGGPATEAQIGWVAGMAVARDGTIYFTDFLMGSENSRIRAVRPDGTITSVSDLRGGRGITIAPDEILYVAGIGGVHRVTPDGVVTNVISTSDAYLHSPNGLTYAMSSPMDVAFDGSGNMYVNNHSPPMIVEFSPRGDALATWQGRAYGGLIGTRDGVLLANFGYSLQRISDGVLTTRLEFGRDFLRGIQGFRTTGLALGREGEVYAGDSGWIGGSKVPVLFVLDTSNQAQLLGTHT